MGNNKNATVGGVPHTWLQDLGYHPAVRTADLRVGDVMVWNTGATSELISITIKGLTATIVERTGGKDYTRTRRVSTLTAIQPRKE